MRDKLTYRRIAPGLLLLLLVISMTSVIQAQDSRTAGACEFDLLTQTMDASRTTLQGRDVDMALAVVVEIRNLASMLIQSCSDLQFSSELNGLSKVVGPVDFPDGIYRVAAEFSDDLDAVVEPLRGECQITGALNTLFSESGEGTTEQIFTAEGCSLLIDIEASGDYRFVFESIVTDD